MAKRKKVEDRVRQDIRNVALRDFEALINVYGFIEEGGKHPRAIIGIHTMPYKRENPIKSCYIKELLEIVDSIKHVIPKY